MKKWVWKEAAEVIGVLGIIAGIVFLALELRQNNELMMTESAATILNATTDAWRTVLETQDVPPLLIKDREGANLTPEEEIRLNALWVRALLNTEFMFERDPERFANGVESWRRAFSAYGSLRRTWAGSGSAIMAAKDMFSPDFVEFMESEVVGASQ